MHDAFARGFILAVMIPALTVPSKRVCENNGFEVQQVISEPISQTDSAYEENNAQTESSYSQESVQSDNLYNKDNVQSDNSYDQVNLQSDNSYDQVNLQGQSTSASKKMTAKFTVDGKKKSVQVETYVSKNADQSSVLATNAAKLKMFRCTFKKTGKTSNVTDSNLGGLNAVLCANKGSSVTLTRGTLTSDAEGANAIIATGVKSVVNASDIKINTTGKSSKGLYVTDGGIIYGNKAEITTKGAHSAPVATDKSGGTIRLTNGTLNASGKDSPCIFSKGNIIVKNVNGTSIASQAAVIEGKNTITLSNSHLTGRDGVLFYQHAASYDSTGTGKFTAENCSIKTTTDCPMFYINTTNAKVELTNTKLISSSGVLVSAISGKKDDKNVIGSNLTLRATNQILKGKIKCDSGSTVELRLADGSKYQGCTDVERTGKVSVVLAADATWVLSGDSYVSAITDLDYELGNIQSLGYNIYYDAKNPANSWLKGTTMELLGGGKLMPVQDTMA